MKSPPLAALLPGLIPVELTGYSPLKNLCSLHGLCSWNWGEAIALVAPTDHRME
jgi:hypothetical protein